MTLPITRDAVERALRAADRRPKMQGGWPRPPIRPGAIFAESVEEADFDPRLHPRDRRGRWRETMRALDDLGGLDDLPPDLRRMLGLDEPEHPQTNWHDFVPKFDADVQAIGNAEQANAYLKDTLGLKESDLTPPSDANGTPEPDWYREIAQAAKDALAKFPALKGGVSPLVGIRTMQPDDPGAHDLSPKQRESVWAATGGDPRAGGLGLNKDDPPRTTYISINPYGEPFVEEMDVADFAAPAGGSIYGRTMHEMGHAVSQAAGFMFNRDVMPEVLGNDPKYADFAADRDFSFGDAEIAMFQYAKITPSDMAKLSNYSQANPAEAWAELFTTLNTINGEKPFDPALRMKIEAARTKINARWKKLDAESGPLL